MLTLLSSAAFAFALAGALWVIWREFSANVERIAMVLQQEDSMFPEAVPVRVVRRNGPLSVNCRAMGCAPRYGANLHKTVKQLSIAA
jgi:hypothetical protein